MQLCNGYLTARIPEFPHHEHSIAICKSNLNELAHFISRKIEKLEIYRISYNFPRNTNCWTSEKFINGLLKFKRKF